MSADDSLQTLLREVRRRLLRERVQRGTRLALWVTAALCLLAIPLHLWLHELNPRLLLGLLAGLWLTMIAWSLSKPSTSMRCADWADRRLGGESAFSTALETESAMNTAGAQALAHLRLGLAGRVTQARRTLRGIPCQLNAARPAVVAFAAAMLLAVVLQMPGRAPPESSIASIPDEDGSPDLQAATEREGSSLAEVLRVDQGRQDPPREGPGNGGASQASEQQSAGPTDSPSLMQSPDSVPARVAEETPAVREAPGGGVNAGVDSTGDPGGREAGTARDGGAPERRESPDTTLLASSPDRTLPLDRDVDARRADATEAGLYASDGTGADPFPRARGAVFPAAETPRSELAQPLGPAATAYVAAYLDSRTVR